MTPEQLEKGMAAGKLPPVLLIHGEDRLQRDRMVNRVSDLVPESMRDFNLQQFLADETTPKEVLSHALTMPFMAPPRVIVLRGVDRYPVGDLAVLTDYLDAPNESTSLVLVADKPNFNFKFYKNLKAKKLAVGFDAPQRRDLASWVVDAVERRGRRMAISTARNLIEQVGTDLNELDSEIEKLSLYAYDREMIEPQDVRAAARVGNTANIFELGDAVGSQRPGQAISALEELLGESDPIPVLAMLIRHFRLLLKAKILLEERARESDAAKALGVPSFVVRKYLGQARNLHMQEIRKGLAHLQEANRTLVTSSKPGRMVMDGLVLKLTALKRRSAEP